MHTRSKLLGAAFAALLLLALAAPVYALPPQALDHGSSHHHLTPPLTVGMTLHITGTGTAFKIDNKTITSTASIDLTANVTRSSHGAAKLTVISGNLKIGDQTYTVVKGRGLINFHSGKVIIHVHLKDAKGGSLHLILFGKASGLAKPLSIGSSFSIDFKQPESKLASKWFLKFSGATAMRVA